MWLIPWTPEYKKVIETYNEFKPSTASQAQKMLKMAYAYHNPWDNTPSRINEAPSSYSRSSTSSDKNSSSKEFEIYRTEMARAWVVITKEMFDKAKKAWKI
jgi:hypothetical protein